MSEPPPSSVSVSTSLAKSAPETRSRRARPWLLTLVCLAAAVSAIVGVTAARVVRQGSRDEAQHADVIVVFGAAEYAGRPSPVYKARLDHAYDLFTQGLAQFVITTGGAGADPTYSEGGVGRDYLARRGIPDRCLIAETQSDDTAESAQRVSAILKVNHLTSVVAVSDAYHIFRIKKLLARQGVTAYGSPRAGSIPRTSAAKLVTALREALSYCVWWVAGR